MNEYIAISFGLLFLAILNYNIFFKKTKAINIRKKQSFQKRRQDKIRENIDSFLSKKIKYSTRQKFELKIKKSGVKITIGDYIVLSLIFSFVFTLSMQYFLNNIFLSILFFGLGLLIPNLFIDYKVTKRQSKMNEQIGSFMEMLLKQYEITNDMKKSLIYLTTEFKGQEPMYSELRETVSAIESSFKIEDALFALGERNDNLYLRLLSSAYKKSQGYAKKEQRMSALNQIHKQFKENNKLQNKLKKRINSPKTEALIMWFSIPGVVLYQANIQDGYIDFMTETFVGKIGTFGLTTLLILTLWFIVKRIGAPIK